MPFPPSHLLLFLRSLLAEVLAVCLCVGFTASAVAGGGPENVLLVVNSDSRDSLTIANHYVQLRHILPSNVLPLSWNPQTVSTDVDTFRQKILLPVLRTVEKRRLAGQIDYVVYSTDFPWSIDLKADVDRYLAKVRREKQAAGDGSHRDIGLPKFLTPVGSLNGLTYLWQPVVAGKVAYIALHSNMYMRGVPPDEREPPTLGFKSSHNFGPRGHLLDTTGRRYMLSAMLGVTSGRGNSVAEVLNYLRRSAPADGTHPSGTIYFLKHIGVRSKARDFSFPAAVEQLKELGVAAKIIPGKLPKNRPDVQGLMIGTEAFFWKTTGSTILPGAICEHLTSFGGNLRPGAGQTPLSELLRYGAAGASGTVTEPYVIRELKSQPKFPTPMIHVHYARGCTLAEAFYQSVKGPYQLLIVGDPLCRPWANIPQVTVQGVKTGATVNGKLTLKPSATFPKIGASAGSKVDRFRLFVDGWQRAECLPGGSLEIDTTQLADGHHDLRVVAVEAGWIHSQGRRIMKIITANHDRTITASISPSGIVRADHPPVITASSPGSTTIVVWHHSRIIGKITGEQGRVTIDSAALGLGPVSLQVVGSGKRGPLDYVTAAPLEFTVLDK